MNIFLKIKHIYKNSNISTQNKDCKLQKIPRLLQCTQQRKKKIKIGSLLFSDICKKFLRFFFPLAYSESKLDVSQSHHDVQFFFCYCCCMQQVQHVSWVVNLTIMVRNILMNPPQIGKK